jgi:hypothetical protein
MKAIEKIIPNTKNITIYDKINIDLRRFNSRIK